MMDAFRARTRRRLKLFWLRYVLAPLKVRHVYGNRRIKYASDELLVVCLAKNARQYINSFIKHYVELGVKHIVILDNDSTDDTVALASGNEKVSVYRCSLPFRKYNLLMRQYLVRRFGKNNHWVLCVDIDELFDYPYSDKIHLDTLLKYLREKSYTTMVAYLLEMFSDQPISRPNPEITDLKKEYPLYDISSVRKSDYLTSYPYSGYSNRFKREVRLDNTLGDPGIGHYAGGIRALIFNLPEVYLIKHPLMFLDGKIKLVHQHFVDHASVADITGVLFHYKFVSGFSEIVDDAIKNQQYSDDSREYRNYSRVLKEHPDICLTTCNARKLGSVNDLIDSNYLKITEDYLQLAENLHSPDA